MTNNSEPKQQTFGWRQLALAALAVIIFIALLVQIGIWRVRSIRAERDTTPPSAEKIAILPDGVVMFAPDGTIARKLADWLESESRDARYFEVGGEQFVGKNVDPTPIAKTRLKYLVCMLEAYPNVKATIIGFTDQSGPKAANRLLSQERAQRIVDLLIHAGISSDRLAAEGRGEEQPLLTGRPQDNERVGLLLQNPA